MDVSACTLAILARILYPFMGDISAGDIYFYLIYQGIGSFIFMHLQMDIGYFSMK
jgi:hypothetical protein